ncbi:MAG TPA: hypothetical protein VMW35_17210 [Myxococcota bacterium]|nr:hypothetical protein [Myxococcota bacterium]
MGSERGGGLVADDAVGLVVGDGRVRGVRFAALRFLEVMHLQRRPSSLFHPRILLRALVG